MKNSLKVFVAMGAFAAVHMFAGGGEAHARRQVQSPFGPTARVQVFIGATSQVPASQTIAWMRVSDGICVFTTIGNGAGLTDDYEVNASSGNDDMRILVGSLPSSPCGMPMTGLVYNGHFLDLFGRAGNDTMSAGNGDTWMWGEDGADRMFFGGFGQLAGGNGNDVLVAASSLFAGEALLGEAGNDCLEDRNAAAQTFDCGAGTDSWSTAFGPVVPNTNCETPISTGCP